MRREFCPRRNGLSLPPHLPPAFLCVHSTAPQLYGNINNIETHGRLTAEEFTNGLGRPTSLGKVVDVGKLPAGLHVIEYGELLGRAVAVAVPRLSGSFLLYKLRGLDSTRSDAFSDASD